MIDRAIAAIRASRFVQHEQLLAELLEPSIRIGVTPVRPEELPLGASRFGGPADLPAGLAWPRCEERPLALIAQLRLDEMAPCDPRKRLPDHGWLYFFFDTSSDTPYENSDAAERSWRVLYFDGDLEQLERSNPPDPRDERNEFPPSGVGFGQELTLPSFHSPLLGALELTDDDREDYEDLVFSLHSPAPLPPRHRRGPLRRLAGRMRQAWIGNPIHRALGHPEFFQVDPRVDWQRLASHHSLSTTPDPQAQEAAGDWLLLLQVDTYRDGPVWLWGDNGTFYFGIRAEDLAGRTFDAVQWTIECA